MTQKKLNFYTKFFLSFSEFLSNLVFLGFSQWLMNHQPHFHVREKFFGIKTAQGRTRDYIRVH